MKKTPVIHPFLFALFPVFFLYARNIGQFNPSVVLGPVITGLCWTLAGLVAGRLLLGDWKKAALAATMIVVPYLSFGQIEKVLPAVTLNVFGLALTRRCFLGAFFVVAVGVGLYAVKRTKSDLTNLTRILNLAAAGLVAMPLASIIAHEVRYARGRMGVVPAATTTMVLPAEKRASSFRPSIFYIILDGYGRADNLKRIYGYDNGPFLEYLRGKGFYIASQARANYSHTRFSIASSLNMDYLAGLAGRVGADFQDNEPVDAMIASSAVRAFTREYGYRFIAFATGFFGTEIRDADVFLADPSLKGEFATGLANAAPALSDEAKSDNDRKRVLFALDRLPGLVPSSGPVFVFAHIVAPHPPYVFGRDGGKARIDRHYEGFMSGNYLVNPNGITRSTSMQRYVDQLAFLNSKIETVVAQIMDNSRGRAVIIIQGDHGPCCFLHHETLDATYLSDRMSILSAYYLPEGKGAPLYDRITPVNTFRMVFNHYFDAGLQLLPDRSFYGSFKMPYRFIDVTDQIGSAADMERYEWLKGHDYFDIPPRADAPATGN